MKGKDLLALLGYVDGQYVEELLEHRRQADVGRSGFVRRCLTVSGAAACMVLTVGIVGKAVAAYQNRAENPQEQQTTIAALQTETATAQTTMEQETYIQNIHLDKKGLYFIQISNASGVTTKRMIIE